MFEIQICPVKKAYLIAQDADLSNVALLLTSSYDIKEEYFKDSYSYLCLHYNDVSSADRDGAFNSSLADRIKSFILSLPPELDALIVCCDSGQSRSSATAAAIMRFQGRSDAVIWNNGRYRPNPLVYKTLCTALGINVSDREIRVLQQANETAFRELIRKSSV